MAVIKLRSLLLSGLIASPFYILWCLCSADTCNPIALSYERSLNYKNLNSQRAAGKRIGLRYKVHKGRKVDDNDDDNDNEVDLDAPSSMDRFDTMYANVDTGSLLDSINSLQNASFATTHDATSLVHELDVIYRGSHELGREWRWFSPVVLEQFKLVFFLPPPSQDSSTWVQLFHKMASTMIPMDSDPDTDSSIGVTTTSSSSGQDLEYLLDYSLQEANEMMTSPEWTRAYFVQDPKVWFQQVYTTVVMQNEGQFLKNFPAKQPKCCLRDQTHQECLETITANPHKFIAALNRGCQDPYWNYQVERMEEKYWPYINFIGRYNTLPQDAQALLQKIGAWEQFGKTGWGPQGNDPIFGQDDSDKQTQLKRWYSYNLEKKVFDFYDPDYQNFNLTKVPDYPDPDTETASLPQ